MGELFRNELLKLKHSKSVKTVFLIFVTVAIILALMPGGNEASKMRYAFFAPFVMFGASGNSGIFIYAAIAAGIAADEFGRGVVRNALSCGVERRQYFIVKVVSVFAVSAVIYLCSVCMHCLWKNILFDFDPYHLIYHHYWQKVLVFNLAAILLLLAYLSFYICLAYLFRDAVKTFIVSVIAGLIDPMHEMWRMMEMIETSASSEQILSWSFAASLIPYLCAGIVCLLAAYQLFQRKDVK